MLIVADRHKYEQELLLARRNAEASVAAHQLAQKELQESRDVLSLAMRGARMGAWSHEPKSGKFWWSRELEALAGYAEGRFATMPGGFFELIHPGDLSALNEAVDQAVASRRRLRRRIPLHACKRRLVLDGRPGPRHLRPPGRAAPPSTGSVSTSPSARKRRPCCCVRPRFSST